MTRGQVGRIFLEVIVLGLALVVGTVIVRGVQPVAPALAGILRALFHPFVLVGIGLIFVLARMGRGRRKGKRRGA